MSGKAVQCPVCHEGFHYEMSPEIALRVRESMGARSAKRGTRILIQCQHCPSGFLFDPATGETTRDTEEGRGAFGSVLLDLTATEDVLRRVSDLNVRGETLLMEGSVADAQETFEEAIKLRRHDPLSWYNLGVALCHLGDVSGGEAAFRHAVEHKRDFVNAWSNLGMLLAQSGRVDEASQCFDRGIEADPDYPKCYLGKGSICAMRGEIAQARRYFSLALEKDPGYLKAQEALRELDSL